MPGLLRGMARTAAVAGTATAVRGRVARRQQQRWAAEDQAQYAPRAAQPTAARPTYVVAQPPPQPAPAPAPAAATPDPVSQLERLAALKQQGILTDEEFAAQKAKILGI